MDLLHEPALGQAAGIGAREVSSLELLDAVLKRVDEHNPRINAVVVRDDDRAREAAAAADAALAAGHDVGALHGVPMTVKECYSVAGMATTGGSAQLAGYVAARHAVVVERLIEAGAIIYGKTNTPYMAGDLQTYNDVYGTTHNPWDLTRSPGGSSGGSAAAVAARLTPTEMGSDIGGSIRNPSALCGVFGHKPSWGIVPLRGHVPGPPGQRSVPDLAVGGPIARAAEDLELIVDIVAGPDEWDSAGWRLELPPARHRALGDFRVGVLADHAAAPVSNEIGSALSDAVDSLARAGVGIVDASLPVNLVEAHRLYLQLLYAVEGSSFSGARRARSDEAFDRLGRDDNDRRSMLVRGVSQRHRHWLAVNERRQRMRSAWAEWFGNVDLLLCPITQTVAYPHDHTALGSRTVDVDGERRDYWEALFWAGIATASLLPATAIPIGIAAGLPVGVQAVGPYLEDRTPLRFAALSTPVLGGSRRPPGF